MVIRLQLKVKTHTLKLTFIPDAGNPNENGRITFTLVISDQYQQVLRTLTGQAHPFYSLQMNQFVTGLIITISKKCLPGSVCQDCARNSHSLSPNEHIRYDIN